MASSGFLQSLWERSIHVVVAGDQAFHGNIVGCGFVGGGWFGGWFGLGFFLCLFTAWKNTKIHHLSCLFCLFVSAFYRAEV